MVTEIKIEMPEYIAESLKALETSGYEAYIVGGCVRDALLCRVPQDWDIATNATPDEVKACFSYCRVLETGVKHGTITAIFNGGQADITTFRVDGDYNDNRHPDNVSFTNELEADLSRRDFTVNALAYNPKRGLVDCFGGTEDLKNRRIVCVGEAKARFSEDALRILRAVRFASTLGFRIDDTTVEAMNGLVFLLGNISSERIASELYKILTGVGVAEVLWDYPHVFTQIIPELAVEIGFDQHTKYHHLDVWNHTIEAVKAAPPDLILRLVMLLHDCGKPNCFTLDDNGVGHFYNHANISAGLADEVLSRLRFDSHTRNEAVYLIKHHCDLLKPEGKYLKRILNKMGEETLRRLIKIKRADCAAQAPAYRLERIERLDAIDILVDEIIEQNQVFSLKDLAVDGNDLISVGFTKGKIIGDTLGALLELVMDGEAENTREALISHAEKFLNHVKNIQ